MKAFLLPAAVGAALGFLTGTGVGGGTLLVLWLTQILSLPQAQAQGINLLYFLLTAPPALLGHRKQGLIDGRTALPAILWGVPVSAAAAFLSAGAAPELLRRAFGGLCFAVGLREVLAKKH